jgi:hypothetical protein
VEALLFKEEEAGRFLESPLLPDLAAALRTAESLAGQQYGPYRILYSLGAGGMGPKSFSVDTAKRDWRMARAWLLGELTSKRDSARP